MAIHETIAAIATPPGQGGIAVVRISGPQAHIVAHRVFVPVNKQQDVLCAQGYQMMYGNFYKDDKRLDEGILLSFRRPHSYTGEDVVELQCHGGEAVSREVLLACYANGAAPAQPGEFTKRAVLNGRLNLAQAEAVMEIINATTRQGVAMAQAALGGALGKAIEEYKQKLVALAGHLAACVDFPEEDVEILEKEEFIRVIKEVGCGIDQLLEKYNEGQIISRGVQAAIVGSPNVGKSTLFNLLSGFERAIVTPVAGTTRDVVREQIIVGGVPLLLADTAGLHETEDVVEKEGIKRSYDEIEKASLVVAVFDASRKLEEAEIQLAQHCKGHLSIAIINKTDLGEKVTAAELEPYFSKVVAVSAHSKHSRQIIENAVADLLQVKHIDTEAAALTNQRQFSAATTARKALFEAENALVNGIPFDAAGVCVDDALIAIGELTGENVQEAVVDSIFENFCVGK